MALGRVPRVTKTYLRTVERLGLRPKTKSALAVGAVVRDLARASELPIAGDIEAPLRAAESALIEEVDGRRLLTAFVRRVKGQRLWVWYRPRGNEVDLIVLTNVPPNE